VDLQKPQASLYIRFALEIHCLACIAHQNLRDL
jgi:hypothetical protein